VLLDDLAAEQKRRLGGEIGETQFPVAREMLSTTLGVEPTHEFA
jgi:hypothetical protein